MAVGHLAIPVAGEATEAMVEVKVEAQGEAGEEGDLVQEAGAEGGAGAMIGDEEGEEGEGVLVGMAAVND